MLCVPLRQNKSSTAASSSPQLTSCSSVCLQKLIIFTTSEEILKNAKIHYHAHKILQNVPILKQMNEASNIP
jgi:hypothetical protein